MHRMTTTTRAVARLAVVSLVVAVLGCAGQQVKPSLEEPQRVEELRLKITKVRNAIEETRATVAKSRGADYQPELYLRLAELLSEEARYHYQLAAEREQDKGGLSNVPQVRVLKNHAIDIYKMMLNRFEGHDLIPRVLFNLGHEHRELGNFAKMRAAMNELIEEHPHSQLRSNALLVMGDYYFDRSKLGKAGRFYRKITRAPLSQVSGLGHYKMAWVEINLGKCESAIGNFEDAIRKSKQWETRHDEETQQTRATRKDIDVRREALVDLTYCYSRERKADGAVAYLKERAYDRATFVAALSRLAKRYRLNDNFEGAILVTREVMRLGPSNRDRIEDARTFYSALKAEGDYANIGEDVQLIADAFTRFYSQTSVRREERERLRKEFEQFVRDLATRAQSKVKLARGEVDSEEAKVSSARNIDPDELGREVAAAYRTYIDTFHRARRLPEMHLNLAQVLGDLGEHLEAGNHALRAATLMDEEGEQQKNALYDAVVFFQDALDKGVGEQHLARISARASLRRAARRLLPYELEDEKDRRVKYAIAQSYYHEGRYLEAIDQLSAVAYEHPNSEEADAAIRLVLDSYDVLNDYDGLRFASKRFLQDDSPASQNLRADINQILKDAQQRKIDNLSLKAAGDRGSELDPLVDFAEQHEGQKMGERALINAFVAARAMGNTSKMYELADKIDQQYPDSDQLPGIYTTVAQMARTRFEFEKAVQFMQRAASVNEDDRVQLIVAAGEIYEQLGRPSEAERRYKRAIEAADGAAQVGMPAGKLASLIERHASADELARKLEPYADTGDPAVLSRLGLAYVAQGRVSDAERAFKTVLESGSGAGVESSARAQYGMAETVYASLRNFSKPEGLKSVQKFISLLEIGQQKYLRAARQGSPVYTAVSLSRLAHMLNYAADRMEQLDLPAGLSAAARQKVEKALEARVNASRSGADDALQTCSEQLWQSKNFSPVVRNCYNDESLGSTLPPFDTVHKGSIGNAPSEIEELRARVSKNPEDVDTLRKLGSAYLEAGNPHAARIAFSEAVSSGGGPKEQNLLGIALFRINSLTDAFQAFAVSAEGGLEAGRQNLAAMLEQNGMPEMADRALEKFPKGEQGGRRLSALRKIRDALPTKSTIASGETTPW